jgi:hypothetical protein
MRIGPGHAILIDPDDAEELLRKSQNTLSDSLPREGEDAQFRRRRRLNGVPGISREADLGAILGRDAMSLDFTAVDFETASSQPGSVCAVGLVRVRAGQVAGKSGGLVRPPDGLGEFTDYQTSVHGITAEMVATAPPWRKIAAWISQYTGPDVLICHDATFTIGVLRNACAATIGVLRNACAADGVTKRTNILVIGDLNPAVLIPGAVTTGKARPRLRPAGQGAGHRGHDGGRLHSKPLTGYLQPGPHRQPDTGRLCLSSNQVTV